MVSVTIHDDTKIFIGDVCKKTRNHCGRSKASFAEHLRKCLTCESFVILGFCLLSLFLCLSVSLSVCVCLCLCVLCVVVVLVVVVVVVVEGGEEEGGEGERLIEPSGC